MKVILTGATGFVGLEVLRELRAIGHSVRILARSPVSPGAQAAASRYGAELHAGDVAEAGSLAGACRGVDAVVHLVGIISEAGRSTFEQVHTQGTRNVLAAAQAGGVRRFVHMSALGARPGAASRYHQTKWAAEESVRGSRLDYTIFRPSLIYGPRDRFVNLFARIARFSPVVPVLGRPGVRFQPLPVEAVARAFVRSLTTGKSVGQTYDLCGRERLTLAEMIDRILEVLGKKRLKLRVPAGLAWTQAAMCEWVFPRLLGRPPPLNRDQLIMLSEDNRGEPEPANGLFGLPTPAFREGIRQYLKTDTTFF